MIIKHIAELLPRVQWQDVQAMVPAGRPVAAKAPRPLPQSIAPRAAAHSRARHDAHAASGPSAHHARSSARLCPLRRFALAHIVRRTARLPRSRHVRIPLARCHRSHRRRNLPRRWHTWTSFRARSPRIQKHRQEAAQLEARVDRELESTPERLRKHFTACLATAANDAAKRAARERESGQVNIADQLKALRERHAAVGGNQRSLPNPLKSSCPPANCRYGIHSEPARRPLAGRRRILRPGLCTDVRGLPGVGPRFSRHRRRASDW